MLVCQSLASASERRGASKRSTAGRSSTAIVARYRPPERKNGEQVGSGKLDLNFVNEGKLYDTGKWEDLKSHQPFFAQINTLEAEYDIYDRQTWRQPRVEWKGEKTHKQIATPENVTPRPTIPTTRLSGKSGRGI